MRGVLKTYCAQNQCIQRHKTHQIEPLKSNAMQTFAAPEHRLGAVVVVGMKLMVGAALTVGLLEGMEVVVGGADRLGLPDGSSDVDGSALAVGPSDGSYETEGLLVGLSTVGRNVGLSVLGIVDLLGMSETEGLPVGSCEGGVVGPVVVAGNVGAKVGLGEV